LAVRSSFWWPETETNRASGDARMSGHWPVPTEKRRKKLASGDKWMTGDICVTENGDAYRKNNAFLFGRLSSCLHLIVS
jgi:hypothetical protein